MSERSRKCPPGSAADFSGEQSAAKHDETTCRFCNGTVDYTAIAPCWCCGEPAPIRGEDDPWKGRLDGYCESCATTRCDTTDSTCAVKNRDFQESRNPKIRDAAFDRLCVSKRKDGESVLRHALCEILLVESGQGIRHDLTHEERWQSMTDIARAALEADRG